MQDHGRWCVGAHIQAFTLKLSRSRSVAPPCTYPSIHPSPDEDTLKITVGCRLCTVFCVVWCGMCGVRVVCVYVCICVCVCVLTWLCACDVCCFVLCVVVLYVLLVVWCCVVLCGVVRLGMRKTPPCVDSKRLRVYVQHVPVCTGKTPACSTHVGVFRVHTEAS